MPASGGLYERAMFGHRYTGDPLVFRGLCDVVGLSLDAASTAGAGDHSVLTAWGLHRDNAYKLGQLREQFAYPDLRRAVLDWVATYRPDFIVVENTSNGRPIADDLEREFGEDFVIRFNPGSRNKAVRTMELIQFRGQGWTWIRRV
jgi:phage terminase large subunit-like protein